MLHMPDILSTNMANSFVRTVTKVTHIIRSITLRRTSLLKFLIGAVLVTLLFLKMTSLQLKNTVYRHYKIVDGFNEGLIASDPRTFHLNGQNLTITSGTIHYFRVDPNYWRSSLRKLRAMGAVAVETYAPWNLHEPYKDVYDFGDGNFEMSKFLDVVKFINMAKEEDLLVIFRPGPYICSEWDFGGLPSYLLGDGAKARTSDPKYMTRVEKYFGRLLPLVVPLQIVYGGPIIMFQVENEYGSLLNLDHEYMILLRRMMESFGIKGLYFTSDSPRFSLDTGALPELGVLQTANFKEHGALEMSTLLQIQPDRPVMVMEYWTGWFDHWDKKKHNIYPIEVYLEGLKEILALPGSVNLYVFHGGTSFGFLNGANTDGIDYHPDISSYDYDAILTEAGDYTDKYFATLEIFRAVHPLLYHPPPPPLVKTRTLSLDVPLTQELLWSTIVSQMPEPKGDLKNSKHFIYMEDLPEDDHGRKQNYGYVRYSAGIKSLKNNPTLKLTGKIKDIAIVLADGVRQTIVPSNGNHTTKFGFWASKEDELVLRLDAGMMYTLELFVENAGRINFVKLIEWMLQKKGLGPDNEMTLIGAEFTTDIDIMGMPFDSDWVTSLTGWQDQVTKGVKRAPSLVKGSFYLTASQICDTFLDIRSWKRGVVYVNGFNIGRYFSGGPQLTMYIPAPLLKVGKNTIIIFEHYSNPKVMRLVTEPSFLPGRYKDDIKTNIKTI